MFNSNKFFILSINLSHIFIILSGLYIILKINLISQMMVYKSF